MPDDLDNIADQSEAEATEWLSVRRRRAFQASADSPPAAGDSSAGPASAAGAASAPGGVGRPPPPPDAGGGSGGPAPGDEARMFAVCVGSTNITDDAVFNSGENDAAHCDYFNGTALSATRWTVVAGTGTVSGGALTVATIAGSFAMNRTHEATQAYGSFTVSSTYAVKQLVRCDFFAPGLLRADVTSTAGTLRLDFTLKVFQIVPYVPAQGDTIKLWVGSLGQVWVYVNNDLRIYDVGAGTGAPTYAANLIAIYNVGDKLLGSCLYTIPADPAPSAKATLLYATYAAANANSGTLSLQFDISMGSVALQTAAVIPASITAACSDDTYAGTAVTSISNNGKTIAVAISRVGAGVGQPARTSSAGVGLPVAPDGVVASQWTSVNIT